jgi:hypothetical protein
MLKIIAMKTAGLIFLLSATLAGAATTNQTLLCCQHPLRVFGDHSTVNLTPLFQWWTHHENSGRLDVSRPLAAWHRITGVKVAELEYNWVVDAVIYTSPTTRTNARIILRNPPAAEEQLFYNLKAGLAAAGQQITNDQRTYQNNTKAAQQATTRAQAGNRSRNGRARVNAANSAQQAAQDNSAATAALDDQKQLETSRALAEKQLAAIPAEKGKYRIDWFAMEIGRNKQGVLIYDLGVVETSSP